MAKTYTIVKKNGSLHEAMKKSHEHQNAEALEVGGHHVLIPATLAVSYGHVVSHAKNKTPHRRLVNARVLHVMVDGFKKAIRLSNRDLRTFKKITAVVTE